MNTSPPLIPMPAPVLPAGRVLYLTAGSDLVVPDGFVLQIEGRTPMGRTFAYVDGLIWNSRASHGLMPMLFAGMAAKLGVPADQLDAIDWISELMPSPTAHIAGAVAGLSLPPGVQPGAVPPPAACPAPEVEPVHEPRTGDAAFAPFFGTKVGQKIQLEGDAGDGRRSTVLSPPVLWNLADAEHYDQSRRTILTALGIDPDDADAAAAVIWSARVVEGAETVEYTSVPGPAEPSPEPDPGAPGQVVRDPAGTTAPLELAGLLTP